ncbi:transcriptional regulator [Helicobacter cappadocius]|uniref:Transcriptional regulator n=1 Tax=Helicobacter cappadocius TaxID=3063998 RepID=A0AA90TEQ4_9HELI|nr:MULTISPECIES: transcriptional regulator [unclassified Helicobacter]MDO7252792.1 transcriptional regulator [Helicobacter sp. faydin-H75]MDP2538835.1 transcriptional regulator [Helicobacter sp. faydin-H76]
MSNEQNLIKKTAKELRMTYKELGEAIGYSGDSLNNMASKDNSTISNQIKKAIELYLENLDLKKRLEDYSILKNALKNIVKEDF